MLVSRAFDLQALATKDDKLVLACQGCPQHQRQFGAVLYVAIHGTDRDFECVVYQPTADADFACMSEKDATHSITVTSGMVTPVKGVMTSTFGPRMHPILHQVRIHKGVDWGAPIGTPIMAAFDGKIAFAGDGKGCGNVVKIDHGGGQGDRLRAHEPLRQRHESRPRGESRRCDRLCRDDGSPDRAASALRTLPERRGGRPAGQRGC